MARRSVWLVTGVVAGAASSLYAERKLRRTLEAASARLQPDSLVSGVGRTARQAAASTTGRVRDAVASGRSEMQRREEEIWAGLAAPNGVVGPVDGIGSITTPKAATVQSMGIASGGNDGTLTPAPESEGDTQRPVRGRGRRRSRRSPSHLGK